jgi:hypothetical protein
MDIKKSLIMKKNLLRKEFPYLLTVVMAGLFFFMREFKESFNASPVLLAEISVENSRHQGIWVYEEVVCTLENASLSHKLNDILVHMSYPNGANAFIVVDSIYVEFTNPDLIPVSPAGIVRGEAESRGGLVNQFRIDIVQPGTKYILKSELKRHYSLKECPVIYITSSSTIRLASGIEAWIIRNAMILQLFVIILLIFLILGYLYFLRNEN